MNAKQNARLAMYIVTAGLDTEGDPFILAKMPQFPEHLVRLRETITWINLLTARQDHFMAGASLDKQSVRTTLENQAYDIAASARAMAVAAKEFDLAEEWHLAASALQGAKDSKLLIKARSLATLAASRESDLLPFGITNKEILALTTTADQFELLMPYPRKYLINKGNTTKELLEAFAQADEILAQMDILADTLRNRYPIFHADYKSRRTIIPPPRRITSLLGVIRDQEGNILIGATITVDGYPIKVRSTKTGKFRIPHLTEGVYTLRVNMPGFRELVEVVTINQGRTARPSIELREA